MTVTIPSITQNGRFEPFELQVGRGQITFHSIIHVFGHNPDVDSTEVTVWPATGILTHPASPVQMTISSTSANDTALGTGARTVYILGINGTGGFVSETVTLSGQTAVTTVHSYDAIEQMTVTSIGSGGVNAGTIYAGTGTVTAGVPATIYSAMGIGDNLSLVGHWTCPTGYTGYLTTGSISTGNSSGNQYITGRLKQRGQDGIVRTAAVTTVSNGTSAYEFSYPIKILEGECITATAKGTGTNNDVSSYFQIILIKNDGSL
jgi:hypothetical protein